MKWLYTWEVEYYGENCMIRRKYIDAHSKQDALRALRSSEMVVEVISCRRIDTW